MFGWDIKKWDGPIAYWLISTGDCDSKEPGINGGLLLRQGPAPADMQPVNAYVCTVGVASVDTAVNSVMANGGTLALAKMAVPNVGWLAYVKDTEGNLFGIMQPDPAAK